MTAVVERAGSPLHLALLRSFELLKGGSRVSLSMSTQRVLALLALRDRPVLRVHAAGTLWLDSSDARACANLRTAVWRLRRLDPNLVETSATHVGLGRTVCVDVREAIEQAQHLLDPNVECDGTDLVGSGLSADLLPDWYEDWLLLEQERFRQLRLHALEALCQRLTAARQFGAAVEAGLAAVAGDPLRESAHRALINVYLAEGNTAEAVRQYRSYRRMLRAELGLEPSDMIRNLVDVSGTALKPATA